MFQGYFCQRSSNEEVNAIPIFREYQFVCSYSSGHAKCSDIVCVL